jgi:beta-glucanase (GH16 family)
MMRLPRAGGRPLLFALLVAAALGGLASAHVATRASARQRALIWRPAQPDLLGADSGRLVWSDEFGGRAGSAPDASKWTHNVGAYGYTSRELQTYTGGLANAYADGRGHLAIVARRQTATGPDGRRRHFTSARLTTQGLFSTTYGRFEARMKIPAGRGLWPAFWMLGDDVDAVGWPASGEIDAMEVVGQHPFTVYGTLHGPRGAPGSARSSTLVSTTPLASAFHTYGVTWSPTSITWMFDGVPYATKSPGTMGFGWNWIFARPFHLLVNLAVGGTWPGPPDASTRFPARLLVDWVRVYR